MFLKYFDVYAKLGFKPIAVYKNTKCPIGNDWNSNWSIERWRHFFEESEDKYNMGFLLGDIIDVEGDTEDANDLLERMIDGVPHPKFRSSKSIHHLFLSPTPELTRCVFGGIEFRGHRHQSVVPPSTHKHGMEYKWLADTAMNLVELPEELMDYFNRNYKGSQQTTKVAKKKKGPRPNKRLKVDHIKTVCKCCSGSFFMHKGRLSLEVNAFKQLNLPWMCRGCREIDIRDTCRAIRHSPQAVYGSGRTFPESSSILSMRTLGR